MKKESTFWLSQRGRAVPGRADLFDLMSVMMVTIIMMNLVKIKLNLHIILDLFKRIYRRSLLRVKF